MSIEKFAVAFQAFEQQFKADARAALDYAQKRLVANQRGQGETFLSDNQHGYHTLWCAFERDAPAVAEAFRAADTKQREAMGALLDQYPTVVLGLLNVVEWHLPLLHQKVIPVTQVQPLFDFFAMMEDRPNAMRLMGTLSSLCEVVAGVGGNPADNLAAAAEIAAPKTAAKLAGFKPIGPGMWPS